MSSPTAAPVLKQTALNATHRALKAKMVDFGGWDMPVEYSGLMAEHLAVRTGVGLFDVSHMGEIQFRGPNSLAAVQRITMNDASRLKDGQAQYSALLTPEGTFVDDILVHKLGDNDYLLVVTPAPKTRIMPGFASRSEAWPASTSAITPATTRSSPSKGLARWRRCKS
jgi:aminomethyltransferase